MRLSAVGCWMAPTAVPPLRAGRRPAASGRHVSPVAPLPWASREAHRVRVPRRGGARSGATRGARCSRRGAAHPCVRGVGSAVPEGGARGGSGVPFRAVPGAGRGRPCPLGGGGAPSCCAVPPAGGSALGRPALAAPGGAARGGAARAAAAPGPGPGPGPEAPWPAEGRLLARPAPPRAALRGARHGCAAAPPPGPLRRRRRSTGSARFPARRCPAGRRR